MAQLDRLLVRIEGDVSQLRTALGQGEAAVTGSSQRMNGALQKLSAGFGMVTRALGAIGVAVSAASFVNLTRQAIDAAGRTQDLAQQLGIAADSLQALSAAARDSGVGAETLEGAIARLNESIGEAAGGNKQAVQSFADLGVAFRNADGSARSVEAVLGDLARRYAEAGDKTRFLSNLTDVMGRSAGRLRPILDDIANHGLQDFIDKQREAGEVASNETIRTLAALGDEFDRLGNRILVMTQTATAAWVKFLGIVPRTQNELLMMQRSDLTDRRDAILDELSSPVVVTGRTSGAANAQRRSELFNELQAVNEQLLEMDRRVQQAQQATQSLLQTSAPIDTSGVGGGRSGGGGRAAGSKLPPLNDYLSGVLEKLRRMQQAGEAASQSQETYAVAIGEVQQSTDDGMAALAQLGQTLSGLVTGAADAKSALGSIIQFLFQQLQQGLSGGGGIFGSLLGGLLGGLGGGVTGGGDALTFGGLFAAGGRIGAREFGIVGERGPELIRGPAVVTPMSRAGMTVIIDARGADRVEFERVRRELRALNASVEERAVAANVDARRRGGSFARTFR